MKHEEQLRRMAEAGIISNEQSESLKVSLDNEINNIIADGEVKKIPKIIAFIVITIIIVLAVYIVNSGSTIETETVENVSKTLNEVGGIGKMNRMTSGFLAISVFLIIPIIMFVWLHNGLVSKEEKVKELWSQVESNYQRRSDLIPNLIETVSKFMKHEKSTLENVTDARGGGLDDLVEALVNAQKEGSEIIKESGGSVPTDEEYITSFNNTQQRISGIMHRMMATVEDYPELHSSEQMMELQAQLEGTENRINVARTRFNEAVSSFNSAIRVLPGNLIASIGDFKRKAYFKSDSGSEKAVKVEFK